MKKIFKFFKDKIDIDSSVPILEAAQLTIDCHNKNLKKFPYRIPSKHPIESIDISFNAISDIPASLTCLKFLNYSNNNLTEISPSVEKAILSYNSLAELRTSSNSIEIIPPSFKEIKTLKIFISNSNKLREFDVVFPNVDVLDLSCNMLTNFYLKIKTLKILNLSFNRLTKIDFVNELNTSNLKELFLSGNDLSSFPGSTCFNSLTLLNISYNKIQSDLPNFSKITPNLKILDFSYNEIRNFPEFLPSTIHLVRGCHNRIKEVPSLEKYTSLESLLLDDNEIERISGLPHSITEFSIDNNLIRNDSNLDIRLPLINRLFLNRNCLTDIPQFSGSEKVEFFSMVYNNLSFPLSIGNIPKSIVRLDLSCNNLTMLPIELFTSLHNLKQLFVFQNQIEEIPQEIVNSSITILNVSCNPLTSLPQLPPTISILCAQGCNFSEFPVSSETMKTAHMFTCIDLSNNKIETIPKYIEADESEVNDKILFLNRIETFLLSCNRITSFPEFSSSIRQIDLSQNCIESVFIDEPFDNLSDFDISHNKLTSFVCTKKMASLSTLKLSHNKCLSLKFSYSNFPKLDTLDIGHTGVVINSGEPRKRMRELIRSCSYSISPATKIFTDDDSAGYSEMKGNRRTMEDALIIRHTNLFDIYGVVDGHAGDRTSTLTAFKLPEFIDRFDKNTVINSIQKVNGFLLNKNVEDGATIALVLLKRNTRLIALNIGDTRALVVKNDGSAISLSIDHKPSDRCELEEIRKKGGFVSLDDRTSGILSISRAIGDFAVKGVSAIPNICEHQIADDDYRLVVACDGVFDVLTNEEVGRIVLSEESPLVAAYKVRNTAYSHLSDDNISVIVVDLHSQNQNEQTQNDSFESSSFPERLFHHI